MSKSKKNITRVHIKGSLQEVWEALTKQGEPLPFFFGSVMHTTGLHSGAQIRMRTDCGKYTGVVGEILEVDPPHKFSHTFKFTHVDDPPCKVTYELREVDGGVEFTLISEDMPPDSRTEKDMVGGAQIITASLKGLIEDGRPPLKSRFINFMCKLTKFMTPAKCLTGNTPMD